MIPADLRQPSYHAHAAYWSRTA